MKKIVSALMLIVLAITPLNVVNAYDSGCANVSIAENVINQYREDENIYYTIREYISLRSFINDEISYTLYFLEPYGYAILYNDTYGLMEACYQETEWLSQFEKKANYYYGGPGNYFVDTDDYFESFFSNNVLEEKDIQCIKEAEIVVQNNEITNANLNGNLTRAVDTSIITRNVAEDYFANLDEHGTNVNGTCTVLATCMLLGYFDEFRNDNYILDVYRDGDGTTEEFHQYMNSVVYGEEEEGGIYIREALVGVNRYLSERGVGTRMHSEYTTPNQAVKKIMNTLILGYPVVASTKVSLGAQYNHTMVVYGMKYNSTTGLSAGVGVFRVHMGWSSSYNSLYVNSSWFYECGYIE